MNALKTSPPVYPSAKDLAKIVDGLRAAGAWPATLTPGENQRLPWLSRIARAAGFWGWAVAGLGIFSAIMACRRRPSL